MSRPQGVLRLGARSFEPQQLLVMAIVNRTPDSLDRKSVV